MTLNAGDIIATGTPSGVSQLNAGDVCEIEIEGIGSLSNPVCLSNFEIE
jgi:2-keto-4-pentenoate hydratase/2-oxohepta-3-ene-1,7-dioic acid hydratase in catechol pathway